MQNIYTLSVLTRKKHSLLSAGRKEKQRGRRNPLDFLTWQKKAGHKNRVA